MARMISNNHVNKELQRQETGVKTLTYDIPSVNCGQCKKTIEQKVGELTGVALVKVDVLAKQAIIKYSPPAAKLEIETLLNKIGHPPVGE